MTEAQAETLLDKYGLPPECLAHCRGVSRIAYETAVTIRRHNPGLNIDVNKVKLAGLLHDIGRSQPGDHECNSVGILHDEGEHELAEIVMHGTLYEAYQLRGQERPELLPRSVENKIVAYADTRFRLSPMTLEERIAEIRIRRADDRGKIQSLRKAVPRLQALTREIESLMRSSIDPTAA